MRVGSNRKIFHVVNFLLVVSGILFATIYAIKNNYLSFNTFAQPKDVPLFLASLLFLVLGFVFQSLSWWRVLRQLRLSVNIFSSMESQFLTIFAKYIPGKIWMVLGRSHYLSVSAGVNAVQAAKASTITQLLALISGLLLALTILFPSGIELLVYVVGCCAIYMMIYKRFKLVRASFSGSFFSMLSWLSWGLAYAFLLTSNAFYLSNSVGIFACAALLGIVALIFPGGLGVREGVMIFLLRVGGIALEDSVMISVLARVWFLSGEGVVFILGLILKQSRS